jgi:hypothetical protein
MLTDESTFYYWSLAFLAIGWLLPRLLLKKDLNPLVSFPVSFVASNVLLIAISFLATLIADVITRSHAIGVFLDNPSDAASYLLGSGSEKIVLGIIAVPISLLVKGLQIGLERRRKSQ